MNTQKTREPKQQGEAPRRSYERPAVSWEEDFEPYIFSACGKLPSGGAPCRANKNS